MNYRTAKKRISEMIQDGGYSVGDKIPSINKLSESLGIGRISVQQAIKMLSDDGVLENIPRSGCYVKNAPKAIQESEPGVKLQNGFGAELTFVGGMRKKIRIGILADLALFSHQWKKLFLDYMKTHPDIDIEISATGNVYAEDAFDGKDIFQVPLSFVADFARKGALYSIDDIGGCELKREEYPDGFISSVSHGKKLWGVPLISAVSCIYYNREYQDLIARLDLRGGFWSFMESVRIASESMRENLSSVLALDIGIGEILKMTSCGNDSDELISFRRPETRNCLKRFERYFQDTRITAPFLLRGHSVTETAVNNFLSRKSAIIFSGSHNMPVFSVQAPFDFGLLPMPMERNGTCSIASNVNVISSSSRYPMECAEILNHLASYETQAYFAREGRLVANRRANRSLKIKGLDSDSHANLTASIEKADMSYENNPLFVEFTHAVFFPEAEKWQRSCSNADEFMESIRKRAFYFFKNSESKSERWNDNDEKAV